MGIHQVVQVIAHPEEVDVHPEMGRDPVEVEEEEEEEEEEEMMMMAMTMMKEEKIYCDDYNEFSREIFKTLEEDTLQV